MKDGRFVVMCVDDEQEVRDGLRMVLEASDYVVVEADSREAGQRVFEAEKPDAVIVDMMMEEMDTGLLLTRDLRESSDVPIFLLSSVGDGLAQAVDYSTLGLTVALQKPVAPEKLLEVLSNHLGGE